MRLQKKQWETTMGRAFPRGYERRFHCLDPQRLKELAKLRAQIRARQGHALVIGADGMGKTNLLARIVEECRAENTLVVQLTCAPNSCAELIEALLLQLAPGSKIPDNRLKLEDELKSALGKLDTQQRILICIDDAHHTPDEVMRRLLDFSSGETADDKVLFSLVLAGTDMLAHRLEQLLEASYPQHVLMTVTLAALDADAVARYIRHQLNAAGIDNQNLFRNDAIDKITNLSKGVPEEISALCGLAMHYAFLEESPQVTSRTINQVSRASRIAPIEGEAQHLDLEEPLEFDRSLVDAPTPLRSDSDANSLNDPSDSRLDADTADYVLPSPSPESSLSNSRSFWVVLLVTLALGTTAYFLVDRPDDTETPALADSIDPKQDTAVENPLTSTDQSPASATVPDTSAASTAIDEPVESLQGLTEQDLELIARIEASPGSGPDTAMPPTAAGTASQDAAAQAASNETSPALAASGAVPEKTVETTDHEASAPDYIPFEGVITNVKSSARDRGWQFGDSTTPRRWTGTLSRSAKVRTRPSTRAPTSAVLQKNATVSITGRVAQTNWYQVLMQFGEYGYVYGELLRLKKPGPLVSAGIPTSELQLHPLDELEAARLEIPQLLLTAANHLEADRLLAPKFDNALYTYREVMAIDPGNSEALEGIDAIKTKLLTHSEQAEARGDLTAAQHALKKVLTIDPNDARALRLLATRNDGKKNI